MTGCCWRGDSRPTYADWWTPTTPTWRAAALRSIEITRAHPDFAALSIARVYLGEHRASSGVLYQRIRQVRGMNYGDYAYIEAFPRGMFQFFPEAGVPRRAQLFEVWIRPIAMTAPG